MWKILVLLAFVVVANAADDAEYYRSNTTAAVAKAAAKNISKPLFASTTTAASIVQQVLQPTLAPNNKVVNGTKSNATKIEDHPVLRAIHMTVCHGLPGPKPAVRATTVVDDDKNTVVLDDGQKLVKFRAILPSTLPEIVQTATNFMGKFAQFKALIPQLQNTTDKLEVKVVFGDVKARLYRNVFRTAISLLLSAGVNEAVSAMGNNVNAGENNLDKLCAKLTQAEQEAMDFQRITVAKRGMDDTGRHDPNEVSDGENEEEDVPTWF